MSAFLLTPFIFQDGRLFLIEEFFPLGGLDVQLEIWDGRLSVAVRCCIAQQICEVGLGNVFWCVWICLSTFLALLCVCVFVDVVFVCFRLV
jgi:hypothetical protein